MIPAGRFAVALRFARRDLRGGFAGFGAFLASIALGVAAIAVVALTARAIGEGISGEGRTILGGDLAINFGVEPPPADALAFLAERGATDAVTLVNSMARRADGGAQALVRVKAVGASYPLVGTFGLVGGGDLQTALAEDGSGRPGVAIEPILADRLGLKIGDPVMVGRLQAVVRGLIADEPDKAGTGVAFGPRLMMSTSALVAADLVQPGSLVQRIVRLRLVGNDDAAAVTSVRTAFETTFGKTGWRVMTRDNAAPGLKRNLDRFSQFLTLLGLSTLLVGGVGVAGAVRAFVGRKRETIAILKAVGASGGFVVGLHLAEVMALAAVGVALGLALGVPAFVLAGGKVAAALGLPIRLGLDPWSLGFAAACGGLTAVIFAVPALGRAHDVPVSALLRDRVAPDRRRPRRRYLAATGLAAALLAGLAVATAADQRVALIFVVAAVAVFGLFTALAAGIRLFAGALPGGRLPELRLALRNIHRPGGLTAPVVLSLGIGLTLMVAVVGVDRGLHRALVSTIPDEAPTFFVLDVRGRDLDAFKAVVADAAPGAKLEIVPMLRGRIKALGGVPVSEIAPPEGARWALDGDRGITVSADLPKNSTLSSGAWWPPDYTGEPLVSFEEGLARDFGLKVGDRVTVSVLGREITARIANTRRVEWASLSINFVMVFSPNSFAGAPFSVLSTVSLGAGDDREREAAFIGAVVKRFPTATVVRVKDVLAAVNDLVAALGLAARAAAGLALVASVLVLSGALAAGHRERLRDAVLLKTFGATRRRVLLAFATEYGLLGLMASVPALVLGGAAANAVLVGMMGLPPLLDPGLALGTVATALLLAIGLGIAGTWRVLGAKVAPVLRDL